MRAIVQLNMPMMEVEPVNRERLKPVDDVNREREWLMCFVTARTRAGISQKQAASDMGGISVQLLSAQETGVEGKHLSFRRMFLLGAAFWMEAIEQIADFYNLPPRGLTAQDEADRRLGESFRKAVQAAQR